MLFIYFNVIIRSQFATWCSENFTKSIRLYSACTSKSIDIYYTRFCMATCQNRTCTWQWTDFIYYRWFVISVEANHCGLLPVERWSLRNFLIVHIATDPDSLSSRYCCCRCRLVNSIEQSLNVIFANRNIYSRANIYWRYVVLTSVMAASSVQFLAYPYVCSINADPVYLFTPNIVVTWCKFLA